MALGIRAPVVHRNNKRGFLAIEIPAAGNPGRVSLHLEDKNGLDRGALGEVRNGTISGKN
jgi:hypothetical protein